MLRRALAFALTLVILGAPVATAVCQAACAAGDASRAATRTSAAEHHSCHGDAPPPGTALTAPAHPCGHVDQLPPGRDQAREELASPPAIVLVAAAFAVLAALRRPAPVRVQSRPPLFVALTVPLRL